MMDKDEDCAALGTPSVSISVLLWLSTGRKQARQACLTGSVPILALPPPPLACLLTGRVRAMCAQKAEKTPHGCVRACVRAS